MGLGPLEVVEHREQLADELRARPRRGRPRGRGRPAAGSWRTRRVTRCRSAVRSATCGLRARPPRRSSAASGSSTPGSWPAPAPVGSSPAGARASPVTGSIRRRSRTTTRSPSAPLSARSLRSCPVTSGPSPRRRSRRPRRRRSTGRRSCAGHRRRLRGAPSAPGCWYSAAPIRCDSVASFSIADLIAAVSVPFERRLDLAERGVDRVLDVRRELLVVLLDELLRLVDQRLGLVADLGLLAALACPPRRAARRRASSGRCRPWAGPTRR